MLVDDIKVYWNPDKTVNHVVASTQVKMDQMTVTRTTKVITGGEYIVAPVNPQKLRHRGKKGVVVGFIKEEWEPIKVKLKFTDNNRIGKIDVRDLDVI